MTNEELMKKLDEAIKWHKFELGNLSPNHEEDMSAISCIKTAIAALNAARDMIPSDSGELLPCPCCSWEAEYVRDGFYVIVKCSHKPCSTQTARWTTKGKAREFWNARTTDKILEKLRGA